MPSAGHMGMGNLPDPSLLNAARDLDQAASSLLGGGIPQQPQPSPAVDFGASMADADAQLMAKAIEESMQGAGAQMPPGGDEDEELARILEMSKNQM